jgi:hypothetical protein
MTDPKFVIKTFLGFVLAANSIIIYTHGGRFELMVTGLIVGIPFLTWSLMDEKNIIIRVVIIVYLLIGAALLPERIKYESISLSWSVSVHEVISLKYWIIGSIQVGLASLAIVLIPFNQWINRYKKTLPNNK